MIILGLGMGAFGFIRYRNAHERNRSIEEQLVELRSHGAIVENYHLLLLATGKHADGMTENVLTLAGCVTLIGIGAYLIVVGKTQGDFPIQIPPPPPPPMV